MNNGSGGGAMPAEPWLFACGFRVVVGRLMHLSLPTEGSSQMGKCRILVCEGNEIALDIDLHTAIIGLSPTGYDEEGNAKYHIGELVQANLRARDKTALSIERYFTNVMHQSNAMAA